MQSLCFFNLSEHLLTYTTNITIIGRTKRDVTAAFSAIEHESAKMGLVVNKGKDQVYLVYK